MRRVAVVGSPGSGKSTVSRRLATRLDVEAVELDGIFHQPGWTALPADEFRERVAGIVATDGWVIDGNYSAVQDMVWAAADTVVWLDLPRPVVMRRVTARTLRRVLTREQLWNGNREPWTNLYHRDPMRNIVRYAWMKHAEYVRKYAAAMADPSNEHLAFVRLRSPREVEAFLA